MQSKNIYQLFNQQKKQIAVLIDPDKAQRNNIFSFISNIDEYVDYYFVGGSLLSEQNTEKTILEIKKHTAKPIVIFPGNGMQISTHADAILLLSLISGRNPELLIGHHVQYASILQQSNLEIIPTGYLLIDGGITTTVSYMSNTTPIPQHKPEIAALTALAGTQLGLSCMYLEAGSGALVPVSTDTIATVKSQINVPLIVGGGIRNKAQIQAAFDAGADIVVIGTAIEEGKNLFA
ncbi:MAG: geranylgeranylglyceryl/heptaprenylglyceryl phosphate synthase [Sphingobacteriales bacterium]|jgi:putative glycerol-1-phosphate prenyltransferase|nr:MAG: geranylgeranylglyceryl/heptaprenylglyceryl phosphate synthase [Sphingobacteriales bacterium]